MQVQHYGSITTEILNAFVKNKVLSYCAGGTGPRSILVMDNASSHHNEELVAMCYETDVLLVYLPEADHLLEDDDLDLEAKALPWETLAAEVEAEVPGQTIRKTIKVALCYGKRLACVKGHQSEHAKANRME